ncbi:PREDICTED: E3 ubiquitin-protein ligase TRIM71-like isoform X1 [Acropora digitifera]|uniref:E3 ubiquitin-protein ligase TRIM71-like isoform X1 n=1 Tax=Acropora digitifera TaxID=70779 RepID=UPI00077A803A|nr:PREDICTED: E3 ubiquitin-protein ligase TRIM71-like isoform X1 [Acropora digitifera]
MNDSGNIVVTDTGNGRVQVLTEDGEHLLTFGENGELDRPVKCIYWGDAYIVSSCKNHILNIFDCGGTLLYQIGESGTENRHLPSHLWGFYIESSRNHQNLLVSDDKNGCIYQFTMDNYFTGKTVAKLGRVPVMTAAPDGRILAFGEKRKKMLFLK